MTRARIYQSAENEVTVEYTSWYSFGRVTRVFSCSVRGGYVYENRPYGQVQICDRLAGTGNTLWIADAESLLVEIRKQYRAMYRAIKKDFARYG